MDVFISYARNASVVEARALRDALGSVGVQAFLDEREIAPGGRFPADLAEALLAARVVVLFADAAYFAKAWCVYELDVALAPYRDAGELEHVVVALPAGDAGVVVPYLPPPLAQGSWPLAQETGALAAIVGERLGSVQGDLGSRIGDSDDAAVRSLREGGSVPRPAVLAGLPGARERLPGTLGGGFVGRAEELWRIFHALETRRAGGAPCACVIHGGAGVGKSQLAAEYVWRYGPRHYPAGIAWIDADCDDEALAGQLARATAVLADTGSVLWVVDNVPEPEPDRPPRSLAQLCPALGRASVLLTSRSSVKGADAALALGELAEQAAIELLTRPNVDRSWLPDADWALISRWVGCLPLALHILQTSLGDGYATAREVLDRTRGAEPASALEQEIDALRGEIPDDYLRGVSDALRVSYERLGDGLVDAVHRFAVLAPIPVPETLVTELVPAVALGGLARRGWIEAGGEGGERVWRMHRVAASWLRSLAPAGGCDLAAVADWLGAAYGSGLPATELRRVQPHARALFRAAMARNEPGGDGVARTVELAWSVAALRLEDADLRGIRFLAVSFADAAGAVEPIVSAFERAYDDGEEAVAVNLPYQLGAARSSRPAAALMIRLLSDPRPRVRQRALDNAAVRAWASVMAGPLLDAILAENNEWGGANAQFETLLEPRSDGLGSALSRLATAVDSGDPRCLRFATQILGRLLVRFGDDLATGDWRREHIEGHLIAAALQREDAEVRRLAADALGTYESADAYARFANALDAERAFDALDTYLQAAEAPRAPRIEVREEADGYSFHVFLGKQMEPRHRRYWPIVDLAVDGNPRAVAACLATNAGKLALGNAAAAMLEQGSHDAVVTLADAVSAQDDVFISPYWWRAQAREALGQSADAIEDYGRVGELEPRFADAFVQQARLLEAAGNTDAAIAAYTHALDAEPGNAHALERRAWLRYAQGHYEDALRDANGRVALGAGPATLHHLRGACFFSLERWDAAVDAETAAIEADPSVAEQWLVRAEARTYLGHPDAALADAEHAAKLDPTDQRATRLRAFIQTGSAALG